MGCSSSKQMPALPESQRVAPVEAEFCATAVTTLRLRDRFWDDSRDEDFVVTDAEWGKDIFRIQGTESAMKTLRDPHRKPVVHMKRDLMAPVPTYNVFDAKTTAAKLFVIKAQPTLSVEFTSPHTGEQCRMGMAGSWTKRQASLWLEQGRRSPRKTVGRIFRPSARASTATTRASVASSASAGQQDDEYYLAIMGGVDMSLMVLICVALEQAHTEKW